MVLVLVTQDVKIDIGDPWVDCLSPSLLRESGWVASEECGDKVVGCHNSSWVW